MIVRVTQGIISSTQVPRPFEFHHLVKRGDLQRVQDILRPTSSDSTESLDINEWDLHGYTPLMYAVESPRATVDLVQLLLAQGATLDVPSPEFKQTPIVIKLCLHGGNLDKLGVLLENGADIHYKRDGGYDALIDAVFGRDIPHDQNLLQLLKLLSARGVALNGMSRYHESAIRELSHDGRFDAVKLLLDAGADEAQLSWTPLMRAVGLGELPDVEAALEARADLEETDWWSRTAWLIAIQTGDVAKTRLLLEHGADSNARGCGGDPSLFYAIQNYDTSMLEWLLGIGIPVEQTDNFGRTPLISAVENSNTSAVDVLLRAGADVNRESKVGPPISSVCTREIALRLLDTGADPGKLSFEGRRSLLNLDAEPDEALLSASISDYRRAPSRRFGIRNPEKIIEPFWESMIRAGISAEEAARLYWGTDADLPVWCARRFGQSLTLLPDGRVVQIASEHEDFYDKNFCIYNDVFVHEPGGVIHIFGYPESIFPPTDFHTATLIGDQIYIVGALGYCGRRNYGYTQVCRLDLATFAIERLETSGDAPGWIHEHRAIHVSPREIHIRGGLIVTGDGDDEAHTHNEKSFVLDTERLLWRVA